MLIEKLDSLKNASPSQLFSSLAALSKAAETGSQENNDDVTQAQALILVALNEKGLLDLPINKATVPDASASNDAKRKAQASRSKQFGIEALDGKGERLTYPKGFPTELKLYGDPVNLMFPLDPAGRARNARTRFKQFADSIYEKDESKRIVHTRIVDRLLAIGAAPSFNPDDPLDALLPSRLKDKLQKNDDSDFFEDWDCSDDLEDRVIKLHALEKADEEDEERIAFGIVLEPDEVDSQGDTISAEEIEKTAHAWLAKWQNRGYMHKKIVNSKIELYESYIARKNDTIGGQKVKKGSWLLMYHVKDDATWKEIKEGKMTGFSIGGFGKRKPVKQPNQEAQAA